VLCLLLSLLASGASGAVLDSRTIHSATLANGLRLVVSEDEAAPVVSVEVIVRAGSADDPPGLAGLAHLLEHLCWMGAEGADPRAAIEEVGGATNAGTLRDFTRFYATVQPADLGRALQALAAMVRHEDFPDASVSRERTMILQEAATRRDEPRAVLNDLAFQAIYGDSHPYGHHIEGSEESLAAITAANLSSFHRTWYVPNNMAVVAAGKVKFEAVLKEAEAAFGGLSPAALPPRTRPVMARPGPGGERAEGSSFREVYLVAAFVAPAVSEPAAVAASDVMATLLGQSQVGRLRRDLQERDGLVKAAGVDFLTQREQGLFGIWAICDPDKIEGVRQAIEAELARLASSPVPPDELVVAKRLLAAEYAFANETAGDRATTLGFYEAIDSYRFASQYLSLVWSVTPGDIRDVAAWYAGAPMWVVMQPSGVAQ